MCCAAVAAVATHTCRAKRWVCLESKQWFCIFEALLKPNKAQLIGGRSSEILCSAY
jgi:hypothetical protein